MLMIYTIYNFYAVRGKLESNLPESHKNTAIGGIKRQSIRVI